MPPHVEVAKRSVDDTAAPPTSAPTTTPSTYPPTAPTASAAGAPTVPAPGSPTLPATGSPSGLTTATSHGHAPAHGQHHHLEHPVDQHIVPRRKCYYGWQPDLPDPRDAVLTFDDKVSLPPKVDLRSALDAKTSGVYDQGKLGSSTANALAGLIQYVRAKEDLPLFTPSRLAIYYNARAIEGTTPTDAGAQFRSALKTLGKLGACDEKDWPYEIPSIADDGTFPTGCRAVTRPDSKLYKAPLDTKPLRYCRVLQATANMRCCLAQGYPFVAGFTVFDNIESTETATSGHVFMPNMAKDRHIGGLAVLVVGYDDAEHRFICRNSWGPKWGDHGYFTIPYMYLANPMMAGDFWTIRTV